MEGKSVLVMYLNSNKVVKIPNNGDVLTLKDEYLPRS